MKSKLLNVINEALNILVSGGNEEGIDGIFRGFGHGERIDITFEDGKCYRISVEEIHPAQVAEDLNPPVPEGPTPREPVYDSPFYTPTRYPEYDMPIYHTPVYLDHERTVKVPYIVTTSP